MKHMVKSLLGDRHMCLILRSEFYIMNIEKRTIHKGPFIKASKWKRCKLL